MTASRVAQAFGRIRKWIEGHDEARVIVRSFRKPAKDAAITRAEKSLGMALPDDLKEFYRLLDGQDEAEDGEFGIGLFPSAEEGDLAFLFVPLGELAEITPKSPDEGMPGWIRGWLPFGDNRAGDNLVVDLSSREPAKRGRVLQFNHEYSGALPLAASLTEFLEGLADRFEAGEIRFDEECGLSPVEGIDFDEACGDNTLEGAPVE